MVAASVIRSKKVCYVAHYNFLSDGGHRVLPLPLNLPARLASMNCEVILYGTLTVT